MKKSIRILAIETSCDETAAAVIGVRDGQPVILSNIVSSQIDLHAKTGGVVPEVASRAHMEAIMPVIAEALIIAKQAVIPAKAGIQEFINLDSSSQASGWNDKGIDYQKAIKTIDQDITHLAVTAGPGLIGCLLVGFNAAKTLAYAKDLPIIPINHIEGHIYSAFSQEISNSEFLISNQIPIKLQNGQINEKIAKCKNDKIFPVLALTVSGGHTSLTLMKDHGKYETLGETLDDAAGEAFDKVAKMLDLGYPGGPIVSRLAGDFRATGKSPSIIFPRPIINDGTLNFSFSGLKTAVRQRLVELKQAVISNPEGDSLGRNKDNLIEIDLSTKQEICFAFEEAVADVLVAKTLRAITKCSPKTVLFAGGVSANGYLRQRLKEAVNKIDPEITFLTPNKDLCGDNAAMIGVAAYFHILLDDVSSWKNIGVDSNLELK